MRPFTGTPARIVLSLAVSCVLGGVGVVRAQQAEPAQGRMHIVKRGDTLWDLARFYFTNPFLWPVIYEANRQVVEDPDWIYPDERLRIPTVEQGLPVAVRAEPAGPSPEISPPTASSRPAGRTRFYQTPPPVDPNRTTDLELTREPAFAVTPAEFHSTPWLDEPAGLDLRGRVLGLADPASHGDKLPQLLHPFDRVLFGFLRGPAAQVGDSMIVIRFGDRVGTYGQSVIPVAMVRVDSVSETVLTGRVLTQYGEARTGDWIMAAPKMPVLMRGMPRPVSDGAEGRLLAFLQTEPLYGMGDHAFIDLGESAGLRAGDELIAYVPIRPGPDRPMELPTEAVATLTVVRVTPTSSTVRVSQVMSTAFQRGLMVRVVRKMP